MRKIVYFDSTKKLKCIWRCEIPKSTFYHLNKDKKEKIENALIKEFSGHSLKKALIRHIEDARMPRGSFYQYFEDKEDTLKYVIENFLEEEKEEIKRLLTLNDGDIFLTTYES